MNKSERKYEKQAEIFDRLRLQRVAMHSLSVLHQLYNLDPLEEKIREKKAEKYYK